MLLTLACICTRIPNGISILIQQFFDIIDLSFLTSISYVGIELFSLIPSEVEAADVSNSLRIELQSQLNNEVKRILSLIQSIASLNHIDSNQQLRILQVSALKLFRSWLMQGITLTILYEQYNIILKFLCDLLISGESLLVIEACSSLRELILIEDNGDINIRNQIILQIIQQITLSAPSLAPFFGVNGDENVAQEICNFMVSIASNEIILLSSPQNCNIAFFDLLLSCTTLRPRKVSSLTFDVWLGIQDQPVANRHIYLTQEIFYKLLSSLLNQCIYPHGFINWESYDGDDDEDDFLSFRDQSQGSIQDVILVCYYSLQESFFSPLQELIMKDENDWRNIEVILYIIQLAMDGIKGKINSESGIACLQFLNLLLEKCLTNNQSMNSITKTALSKFIGSLTFLLISSTSTTSTYLMKAPTLNFYQYYLPSLQFVFNSISDPMAAATSARALHQLCIQGNNIVTSFRDNGQLPMICDLVNASNQLLININEIDHIPLLSLVEALTRNIVELPHDLAKSQLNILSKPIINLITIELRKPIISINVPNIKKGLLLLSQIIKFCDISTNSNGEHITDIFVIEIFSQLDYIENIFLISDEINLIDTIFELYGKIIFTRKDSLNSIDYVNQIKRITHNIIILLQSYSRSSTSALQCSNVIIELLANKSHEANIFLIQFYQQLIQIFTGNNNSSNNGNNDIIDINNNIQQQISKYEPECMEKFFDLLYNYLLFIPDIIATLPNIHEVILLCIGSIHIFKERSTIRSSLNIIKRFFAPVTKKMEEYTSHYLLAASTHGQAIIYELFLLIISGSSSALWPYIIDTIYFIISGCDDGGIGLDCRQWIHSILYSNMIQIPIDAKNIIFKGIFYYVTTNKKLYKSIMQDFIKICNSEATIDSLSSYTID